MNDLRISHENEVEIRVAAVTEAGREFFAKHFGAGAVGVTVPKSLNTDGAPHATEFLIAASQARLSVGYQA